ncbi:hypothetical protein KVV02_000807 [Mortierella alpina]|uniref:CUE domain-containing protein n=1 Tax=Mortierella alpina TaxID=64518 RepID=A0A9P8CW05_MORAP|nr:hypothetical protein KVV02_000807 [Mortierella alpina]
MSSIANTLLQYFLIVSVAYLYAKAPWNKKTGASSLGGTLGKIRASGLAEYYSGEKKRAPSTKKSSSTEKDAEQKDKSIKPESASDIHNEALRVSTRGSTLKKPQQHHQQQPKRSSSGSPTPSITASKSPKQDLAASPKQTSPTAGSTKKGRSPKTSISGRTSSSDTAAGERPALSISTEEAAKHRRFLSEMFKDVPMSEIDRVIRTVNGDVGEAASILIQEDFTWQCVRRRRSVASFEIA